jgi:glycyl-tRNA synthetase beta chain
LRARLADVRFFFEKDKAVKLKDKAHKLKGIIQNEQLGSVYEKTERLKNLVNIIADRLSFVPAEKEKLLRSAELSKADLVTEMVFEYHELQGKMGGVYARSDGEDTDVANAIYEQYLPNFVNDPLPGTKLGGALAFADKIDSLMSSFVLGYLPKGSGDPYGLRRLALGIIRIMFEIKYEFPLNSIVSTAFTYFSEKLRQKNPEASKNMLEFIRQRLSVYFQTNGFDYDIVDAVLSSKEWSANIVNTGMKIENLREIRQNENFEPFVLLYRRASNILKQAREKNIAFEGKFQDSKLIQAEEKDLENKCEELDKDYKDLLINKKYNDLFYKLLDFKELLGSFFDKVLVMAEEEDLKFNRLALIERFSKYFEPLADFSKIVLKEEKPHT